MADPRLCPTCGINFTPTRKDARFCSAKCRKASYGGTCETCGARTDGSNGRAKAPRFCVEHIGLASRTWTREKIIEWIRDYHAEHGRVPPSTVQIKAGFGAPSPDITLREFGHSGWRDAVRAAGFEPYRPQPGVGRKLGHGHPLMEETARLYGEGLSISQIAERHGVSPNAISLRLRHLGVTRRTPIEGRNLRRNAEAA